MAGRRVYHVKSQPEGLLQHGGNDPADEFATQLEAGIGIDLDEPDIVIGVDHEVKTKYLEIVLPPVGIQLKIGGFDSIKGNILHFWVYHLAEIKFSLAMCGVHISLELIV